MSETQTTPEQDKAARIAQAKAAQPDALTATDARGRVFTISKLGPAAMLNVIEMAGGAAADNQAWLRMAMLLSGGDGH